MSSPHDYDLPDFKLDKFPEQIRWKLSRAYQHLKEFERIASAYMNVEPSGPGQLILAPESTPNKPFYNYTTLVPPPPSLGLASGDFLQNLRSVLDYLVWQLIIANGKTPDETKTAFPVCKHPSSFKKAKDNRLVGVPDKAIILIEQLQPYPDRQEGSRAQPIQILDELTNENKHRKISVTAISSVFKIDQPPPFPHIELEIARSRGGQLIPGERILAFIAFQHGLVKGLEVTAVLSALLNWVGLDVLPHFERFFVR